ncbi:hypothetical protein ASPBRDRAFT_670544 [Aspergillus brasiliensis CBS 101740]|uniref:Uncharacterized protein n=1 Tax=Aspergillus brasiliensis (strain CBS 101740 / IMI 381727 / IBT 21946) TaxID=767769 RepID=A0A1L9UNW3_ASPBC|nr:hypothetical protein ASPBRDRAFT_670544 [Aspergillus brasiliensis CBS 101740]
MNAPAPPCSCPSSTRWPSAWPLCFLIIDFTLCLSVLIFVYYWSRFHFGLYVLPYRPLNARGAWIAQHGPNHLISKLPAIISMSFKALGRGVWKRRGSMVLSSRLTQLSDESQYRILSFDNDPFPWSRGGKEFGKPPTS